MNTEEIQRAANTFDNAVDQMQRVTYTFDNAVDHMQRVVSQFENVAYQMTQAAESMAQSVALMDELLGNRYDGKAKSVNRLAQALETHSEIEKFKWEGGPR